MASEESRHQILEIIHQLNNAWASGVLYRRLSSLREIL